MDLLQEAALMIERHRAISQEGGTGCYGGST